MKYTNVFYINQIKQISGITTWIKEIAKKYKGKDITLIYKDTSDIQQLTELKKYIRVKRLNDKIIECDKLFITYYTQDTKSFIAKETIGVVHTDYELNHLQPFKNVDKVIAVSEKVAKSYKKISGVEPIVCLNPLTIEEQPKVLRLIYIGRLTERKGKKRLETLINEFNNKIDYLLTIVSEDRLDKEYDNVIYLKPRVDVRKLIPINDYLIQLSDDDESYSYSINEALSLGVPIIATKLSCLKELGITKEHGYLLDFDMKDIPIKDIYENIPKVKYTPPADNWSKVLGNKKSTYDPDKLVEVRCIRNYTDLELQRYIYKDELIKVDEERAEELVKKKIVDYENYEIDKNCKYTISVVIPMWEQEELIVRTLDSIPTRDNIDTIVIDDCSKDNSVKVVKDYIKKHKDKKITLLQNKENKGVGYTFNKGLDNATGDYIIRIDSDDYFYTNQLNRVIDKQLDGTDMIYYNLEDNNNRTLEVNKNNRAVRCGAVKFIRRKFIGDTRCPEIRTAEDKAFNDSLLKKNPSEKFTDTTIYHYNYPRAGSLYDLTKRGLL